MSYSPDQLKKALITVLNERVPDLSGIPDHVFSERFEKKMNKLIAREAAHPWAVSNTAVKNLIIAAIVIILMIIMCLSVSGIREAIFNFFIKHFDTYNEVVFDVSQRDQIEEEYEISELPDGFELANKIVFDSYVRQEYRNAEQAWINFEQRIPDDTNSKIIDNERNMDASLELDSIILYYSVNQNSIILVWDQDDYEFWIETEAFALEDVIEMCQSVKPVRD